MALEEPITYEEFLEVEESKDHEASTKTQDCPICKFVF